MGGLVSMVVSRLASSAAIGAALGLMISAGGALAGDCNTDIGALSQKRQLYIEKLNGLAKATKGKLDPVASCPTLRELVKAEGNLLSYLEANKNWCNIPDEAVANMKAADGKSQAFATQACALAVKVKQQQAQQQAQGATLGVEAQKLPTGPL